MSKILSICKINKCDTYLANNKTVENYGIKDFSDNNINVLMQNYFEKKYIQRHNNKELKWLQNLSILDFIFNSEKFN